MRRSKIRRRDVSSSAYLAPLGATFEKQDARGDTHRFRVSRVGRHTVDLEHVATYRIGTGWEHGSGDRYPVSVRQLSGMRRVSGRDQSRAYKRRNKRGAELRRREPGTAGWGTESESAFRQSTLVGGGFVARGGWEGEPRMTQAQRIRARNAGRDYEAETLGGWQAEQGGYKKERTSKNATAARYALLLRRHRRHKAYRAASQSQGSQGAAWDQTRAKRRRHSSRCSGSCSCKKGSRKGSRKGKRRRG